MRGIIPSLNTPFTVDGKVDHASLARLVEHTINAGCAGMPGLAVAGEHTTLTLTEKLSFVEVAAQTNSGRIPFVVSVTSPEESAAVELAKMAQSAGATGICVQLPDQFDRQRILEFLQELSEYSSDLLMVQDLDWSGSGLALEDIVYLFETVDRFSWLKIETQQAGPKYSAVREATNGALNVCGGWAVAQLMDAMARDVDAFIPTGMERIYVAIHELYSTGNKAAARSLFERVLPILNFSNQHIDTSIRFFKELRKAEGIFSTNHCRLETAHFDAVQQIEADNAVASALALISEFQGRD